MGKAGWHQPVFESKMMSPLNFLTWLKHQVPEIKQGKSKTSSDMNMEHLSFSLWILFTKLMIENTIFRSTQTTKWDLKN